MTNKRSTTVVPCHSPEDDRKDICEKYAQHNFSTMFMPLLHTLRCFGLYYENENGSSGSRWTPCRVYCSIVLVIIWAAFLRSLLAYYENIDFGAELFLKLIYSSWVSRAFILLINANTDLVIEYYYLFCITITKCIDIYNANAL